MEFEIISREVISEYLLGINPIPYSLEFQNFCKNRYGSEVVFVGIKASGQLKAMLPVFLYPYFGLTIAEIPQSSYFSEVIFVDKSFDLDLRVVCKTLVKFLKADIVKFNIVDYSKSLVDKNYPSKFVSILLDIGNFSSADDLLKRRVVLRRRNQIRFSQKQGFTTAILEDGLDSFFDLYSAHHQYRNYVVRSKEELQNIFKSFGKKAKIMAAYQGEKMIAAIVFIVDGDYLWMLLNASDYGLSYFQVNNYIYWEVIKWGFEHGIKYIDFGGTPLGDKGNIHYKKGFGVKLYPIYSPIYFFSVSSHWRYWFQRKTWHLKLRWRVIKKSLESFSKIQEQNNQVYGTDQAAQMFTKGGLFPAEKKIMDTYLKSGMHILDIGCGTGRTTSHLTALDDRIVGVDYSESMIKLARQRFPLIDFKVADARMLPFPDSSFDTVMFSFNGLDYLYPKTERNKAITEIRRVLKKGGFFIFSSHNRFRLPIGRVRLREFTKSFITGRLFSNYRWDNQTFGSLLTYCGSANSEIKNLRKAGFKFSGLFGNKYSSPAPISLLESYTYYVFSKK